MDLSALYPDQVAPKAIAEACEGLTLSATAVWDALDNDRATLEAGEIALGVLRAFAIALVTSRTRQAGTRPAHYTHAATCAHCGPVWLWRGAPAEVNGCPWCAQHQAGHDFERPGVSDHHE